MSAAPSQVARRCIPLGRRIKYAVIVVAVALVAAELVIRLASGNTELRRVHRWLVDTHLVDVSYADFVRAQAQIKAVRARLGMERSQNHPFFGFTYNPAFDIDIHDVYGLYGNIQIRINSHGLRGEELPERKPAGEIRILCLGGSTTAGEEVGEADTYPAQLQAMLTRHYPTRRIRVINAGIPSYALHQALPHYALQLYRFEPDFVPIYHGLNDLFRHRLGGIAVRPRRNYLEPIPKVAPSARGRAKGRQTRRDDASVSGGYAEVGSTKNGGLAAGRSQDGLLG